MILAKMIDKELKSRYAFGNDFVVSKCSVLPWFFQQNNHLLNTMFQKRGRKWDFNYFH